VPPPYVRAPARGSILARTRSATEPRHSDEQRRFEDERLHDVGLRDVRMLAAELANVGEPEEARKPDCGAKSVRTMKPNQ
jgi:hypothetical protein